jgi:hypothetical protein
VTEEERAKAWLRDYGDGSHWAPKNTGTDKMLKRAADLIAKTIPEPETNLAKLRRLQREAEECNCSQYGHPYDCFHKCRLTRALRTALPLLLDIAELASDAMADRDFTLSLSVALDALQEADLS